MYFFYSELNYIVDLTQREKNNISRLFCLMYYTFKIKNQQFIMQHVLLSKFEFLKNNKKNNYYKEAKI